MVMRCLALAVILAGCAELGVVSDGTSISVGRASRGYLIDGARLPDRGEGFTTRDVWRARDNRYGTDELIDLLVGVARRMKHEVPGVRLVVADLSGRGGGERRAFHRSHQTGRDADLLYYMRDAAGQPFEPDAMHVFDGSARARDRSGITVDVPRTWLLIRELVTAPEAAVQYVFMYEPIARRLIEHAQQIGEPEVVIARARRIVRQPNDSARHDDHMHVRVYCSAADRAYGCVDLGPMESLAEREAEPPAVHALLAALAAPPPPALPPFASPPPAPVDGAAAIDGPAATGHSAAATDATGASLGASSFATIPRASAGATSSATGAGTAAGAASLANTPGALTGTAIAGAGPAASTGSAGSAISPAASTGAAGSAISPAASTGAAGSAISPAASTGAAGSAINPAASTGAAGSAISPAASTGAAGSAINPAASTGAAGSAISPAALTGAAGSAISPAASTGAAGSAINPAASAGAMSSLARLLRTRIDLRALRGTR